MRLFDCRAVAPAMLLFWLAFPSAFVRGATLTADADAYVQSGTNANTNFGAAATLLVKSTVADSGVDFRRKSYVRFDLGAPLTLASAQVDLTLAPHGGDAANFAWDFDVYGLVDSHVGNNWIETGAGGITWNNAPGNVNDDGSGVNLSDVFNGGPIAQFMLDDAGTPGDIISLDSASHPDLIDFLNSDSDGLVTFIIARSTLGDDGNPNTVHQFYSRNSITGDGPVLTFQEQVQVPEPASLAVWGLLGVVAAGMARRQSR